MTTDRSTDADGHAWWAERSSIRYDEKVAAIAADLHDIANKIARDGKVRCSDSFGAPPFTRHSYAAHTVTHDLMWGIANLSIDSLVTLAADADVADRDARLAASPEGEQS